MQDKELTRAGFGPRAAAYIIDRMIILAGLCVLRAPFLIAALFGAKQLMAKSFIFNHSFLDVLCWLAASAYLVLLTYFTGSTLGKKIMRLRVEKEDGAALGFVDTLYRETIGRYLSSILCIGYLMSLVDGKKRAFHDWLCATRVVYDQVTVRIREKSITAVSGWTPRETGEAPAAEITEGNTAEESAAEPFGWSVPSQTAVIPETAGAEERPDVPAPTEEKED